MNTIYHLGLGSNLGDRQENLLTGLKFLARNGIIHTVSSVFITKPFGVPVPCPDFYNMAIRFESRLSPLRLLCLCKAIEHRCGRPPDSHNQPRTLDIDILLAGELRLQTPMLRIPHPEICNRAFVLLPLLEIDSDLNDPFSGKSYRSFLDKRKESIIQDRFRLPVDCIADR